jgi:hypothetical protein
MNDKKMRMVYIEEPSLDGLNDEYLIKIGGDSSTTTTDNIDGE